MLINPWKWVVDGNGSNKSLGGEAEQSLDGTLLVLTSPPTRSSVRVPSRLFFFERKRWKLNFTRFARYSRRLTGIAWAKLVHFLAQDQMGCVSQRLLHLISTLAIGIFRFLMSRRRSTMSRVCQSPVEDCLFCLTSLAVPTTGY